MRKISKQGVSATERTQNTLNEVLEKRMAFYALAVGATLVAAGPAQAKMVVTPSQEVLETPKHRLRYGCGTQTQLHIDLNNDGVTDLTLTGNCWSFYCAAYSSSCFVPERSRRGLLTPWRRGLDGMEQYSSFFSAQAAAGNGIDNPSNHGVNTLGANTLVGSSNQFVNSGFLGSFSNQLPRYMGVKFLINGETHYGWIGFRSVSAARGAELMAWGYETEPNTPIRTGFIGEGFPEAISTPTSLEFLAHGQESIVDWRRRHAEQAEPQQIV